MPKEVPSISTVFFHKNFKLDPTRPIYKFINVLEEELRIAKIGTMTKLAIEEIRKKIRRSRNYFKRKKEGRRFMKINNLEHIEEIENDFQEMLEINKIKFPRNAYPRTRNYYSRSSLANVQYAERSHFVENSYSGESIVEWNIDGASEQQILDTIQQITMTTTAFKIKGDIDKRIASMLITRFIRQLKGWWDNILTETKKGLIFNAIKTDPTTNQVDQDVPTTLLYTIIKHFIEDPKKLQQRATDQLVSLHCPTMVD